MGRILAASLLLAYNAANAINMPGNFVNLAAAATVTDPAVTACAIAYDAVDYCYSAIPGFSTAPEATQASCLCCASTVELDEYYSSCANYIHSSFPKSSTQYSAFSELASACHSEVPVCGAGGGGGGGSATPTPTPSTTTTKTATKTTTTGTKVSVPAVCTSLQDLLSSCISATPALTTAADKSAASCLCYTTESGSTSFTTELDDLATACAPWAKTAANPTAYSAVVAFEGFCSFFSTGSGTTADTTATQTTTSTKTTSTSSSSTTTRSTTSTSTTPTSTATTTVSRAGAPGASGGLVVWAANLATFVLSFLFLI